MEEKIIKLVNEEEKNLKDIFSQIDEKTLYNSKKVLDGFHKYKLSENHFNKTTGYGYNDIGRDAIEQVFSYVLDAEDSLVRTQFISGSLLNRFVYI